MKCVNCGNEIEEGTLVCPNCNKPVNVLMKKNGNGIKNTIIFILLIVVIILAGILVYVIAFYEKDGGDKEVGSNTSSTTTTTAVQMSREEKVKQSFLNGIEQVKKGEKVDFILCGNGISCLIKDADVTDIKYYADYDKDPLVYSISYTITCDQDDICFYNEQFDDEEGESDVLKGSSYYQVNEDGEIIKLLGNSYPSIYFEEE